YGARVAIIERGRLGGTCVNVGCVPKKVMWHAAELMHGVNDAAGYGFDVALHGHDWARLKTARDAYIERLNGIYARNLERRDVTLVQGMAHIAGDNSVDVNGERYTADRI